MFKLHAITSTSHYPIQLQIAFTWKVENQIHWTMPISETCSYFLSVEIFSLEISYTYWYACLSRWNFFSILWYFCDIYLLYISLNYLNLEGCKCQKKIVINIKKINLITKIDRTVEFFANHMHLIMGNYLVKSSIILLKKYG